MPSELTPAPDFGAIEHAYVLTETTVTDICAQHGISQSRLYRRAQKDGWPLRQDINRAAAGRQPADLAARLFIALDRKMLQFERRMVASAGTVSAADAERDARTLNMLVRLFERLNALKIKASPSSPYADAAAPPAETPPASPTKGIHAPNPLRGELARRLERLRGQIGG